MRRLACVAWLLLSACATKADLPPALDGGLHADADAGTGPGFTPGQSECAIEGTVPADDIDLELVVDLSAWPKRQWRIHEKLTFTAHEASNAVRLFGDQHSFTWSSRPYSYIGSTAHFCTGPIAKGERVTVEFTYDTQPVEFAGLNWAPPGLRAWSTKLANGTEVVAIGPDSEPNGSPLWLFSPQSRFEVDKWHAGVPALAHVDLQVVAPGPAWRVVGPSGQGTHDGTTWRFQQDQPMPIYALSFVTSQDWLVEELPPSASGIPITALRMPYGMNDALALAPKVIDWMEAHIGPYAYSGGITLPVLPQYDLAMENVGNVWFSAWASHSANIVAHELVHQWFGNSVRIAGWEHTWLNEGLTTWVTDYHVIPGLFGPPEPGPGLTWAQEDRVAAADLCRLPFAGPLLLPDGVDANKLWPHRDYHYDYGAAVLHMIDVRLAERSGTTLLALLHDWFALKRGKAVTTQAFRDFLAKRTGDAGYWQTFFSEWVQSVPCPVLTAEYWPVESGSWMVRLRRLPGSKQPMPGLPLLIETAAGDVATTVDLPAGDTMVYVPVASQPWLLRIDPGGRYTFAINHTGPNVLGPKHVTFLPK